MKKVYTFQIFLGIYLFAVTPIFSQDQAPQTTQDNPLALFEKEINDGFAHLGPNAEFLSNKSYTWINDWMPDFRQHRFDSEGWLTVKETFKIGVELPQATTATLRVFDADGQLILEEKHNLEEGIHRFPIDAADWKKGGYIVQLQTKESGLLKKVIKI